MRHRIENRIELNVTALNIAGANVLRDCQAHDAKRAQCQPKPMQLNSLRLAEEIGRPTKGAGQHHCRGATTECSGRTLSGRHRTSNSKLTDARRRPSNSAASHFEV